MATSDRIVESQDRHADDRVQELLYGAVDLHVHPGPSPFPRRIGILDAARQASEAGFRAILVKSHHHSMVTDVLTLQLAVGELPLPVLSGVALNDQVGGVNAYAAELALRQGGRIVWFPTISSAEHICQHGELKFPSSAVRLRASSAHPVRDGDGALLPAVRDVLEVIRGEDAILAGGHLAADDLDVLLRGARDAGVGRLLVNHPNFVVGADPERCRRWTELGAYMEHSLCMYDDRSTFYHWKPDVLLEYIRVVGPERTILSSDLGQTDNPLPVESYRHVTAQLLDAGVPATDLRRMLGANAAELARL